MLASAHLRCAKCGTDNPTHAAFCFACGQSLQTATGGFALTSSTGSLVQNSRLKERYHILTPIGKGGFGAVYKAADTLFGYRCVAIKEMDQSRLSSHAVAEAIEAFKREALLLASLQHPNIPTIYDYFGEAGHWFLVMDFIEGETLEAHLDQARERYLPVEKVLDVGIQLCKVLGYLHTRQPPIIFRDLKPANILLTSSGRISLIDFGIARHFKPGQSRDTIAFGSLGYAPPEQYGKTQTTPRADIYALGATLHQLLTGNDPSQTPFRFAPLQRDSQITPVGLETLIMSMLEIDESRRPANMHAIEVELQRFAARRAGRQGGIVHPALVPRSSFPSSSPRTGGTTPGSILVRYNGHADQVNGVAWSPDGKQIVSVSNDTSAQVWAAASGDHLFTYLGHADRVNGVAWSPDGKRIASASSDATVQVWEADVGICLFTCRGHSQAVRVVAWSLDGKRIASASDDTTVKVWDATDGHHLFTFHSHSDWVRALSWSPDGKRIVSAGDDSAILVWDVTTRRNRFFSKNAYRGHSQTVRAVAWSPGGSLIASGSDDKTVQVWDIASRKPALIYQEHADGLHAVAWSPDGRHIASAGGSRINYFAENTVRIWDAVSGANGYIYRSLSGYVLGVAWSPDGQHIASASSDHSVSVWQAR